MDAKIKNHPGFIAFWGARGQEHTETATEKQEEKQELADDKKYNEK